VEFAWHDFAPGGALEECFIAEDGVTVTADATCRVTATTAPTTARARHFRPSAIRPARLTFRE